MSSSKHEVEQSILDEQVSRPFQCIAAVVIEIFSMLVVERFDEKETRNKLSHKDNENHKGHHIDEFLLKCASVKL